MIADRTALVVSMLGVACGISAQEKPHQEHIIELVEQLKNEEDRLRAADQLVRIGATAVPALLAKIEYAGKTQRFRFQVLSRMEAAAGDAVQTLVALENVAPEDLLHQWSAISTLIPYCGLGPNDVSRVLWTTPLLATLTIERRREIFNQWFRLRSRGDSALSAETPIRDLVAALQGSADGFIRELAAELIAQRGQAASKAIPALRKALHLSHPAVLATDQIEVSALGGVKKLTTTRTSYDAVIHRAVGRALLAADPSGTVPLATHVDKLSHGLPEERLASLQALLELGDKAIDAVDPLVAVLDHYDPRVVREALAVLGSMGPAAAGGGLDIVGPPVKGTIPALERLTNHEDKQIAERAKAALRQITRKQ